jgi:hypothetical protein
MRAAELALECARVEAVLLENWNWQLTAASRSING